MPTEASADDGSDKAEASANDEADKVVDPESTEETPGRVHKFFEIHYTVKIKNPDSIPVKDIMTTFL